HPLEGEPTMSIVTTLHTVSGSTYSFVDDVQACVVSRTPGHALGEYEVLATDSMPGIAQWMMHGKRAIVFATGGDVYTSNVVRVSRFNSVTGRTLGSVPVEPLPVTISA